MQAQDPHVLPTRQCRRSTAPFRLCVLTTTAFCFWGDADSTGRHGCSKNSLSPPARVASRAELKEVRVHCNIANTGMQRCGSARHRDSCTHNTGSWLGERCIYSAALAPCTAGESTGRVRPARMRNHRQHHHTPYSRKDKKLREEQKVVSASSNSHPAQRICSRLMCADGCARCASPQVCGGR